MAEFKTRDSKNHITITLPDILDFARAGEFRDVILESFEKKDTVKINCKKVEVVTTASAQVLIAAEKYAAEDGKTLLFDGLEEDGVTRALGELGFEDKLMEWRQ